MQQEAEKDGCVSVSAEGLERIYSMKLKTSNNPSCLMTPRLTIQVGPAGTSARMTGFYQNINAFLEVNLHSFL